MIRQGRASAQRGAGLIELAIVLPVLMVAGLGVLQMALLWHARVIVEYAAFEAARAGATAQADAGVMRDELAYRLAPLYPKGQSVTETTGSILQSQLVARKPLALGGYRLRILNPTREAFQDWGVAAREGGGRIIPRRAARSADSDVRGSRSGLSLADANQLRIEVTVPYKLKVPLMDGVIARPLIKALGDQRSLSDAALLGLGYLPIRAVATVQMQSDARLNSAMISIQASGNESHQESPQDNAVALGPGNDSQAPDPQHELVEPGQSSTDHYHADADSPERVPVEDELADTYIPPVSAPGLTEAGCPPGTIALAVQD